MDKENFRQFQTIFKAGDKAGCVYLLVSGSVGIFLPDNDTKEPNFFIKEKLPQTIFWEMADWKNAIFVNLGVIIIIQFTSAHFKTLHEKFDVKFICWERHWLYFFICRRLILFNGRFF